MPETSEIKRDLVSVQELADRAYKAFLEYGDEVYLINSEHTLKDILRHVLKETGEDVEEFLHLAREVCYEED